MPEVLQSQLKDYVIAKTVLAVEEARADLLKNHLIQTEPPEIQFTIEVVMDGLPEIIGPVEVSETPEQITTTEKPGEVSTQRVAAAKTIETQTSRPGKRTTTQSHGRTVITDTSETT